MATKKIKDLTIEDVFKICRTDKRCTKCPLAGVAICVCNLTTSGLLRKQLNDEIEIEVKYNGKAN